MTGTTVYCMGLAPILLVLLHSIGLPLVLCRVYCMDLTPILLVLLRQLLCLLVHDWYYVEFNAWALLPYS
jgi:hypothetical protein